MLAAVIGWARHRGAHKVLLEVWPTNARAIGLYEKFGFVVEGRHPRHWRRNDGSLWDSLSMGLVLDTDAPGGPEPAA
jgi:RimJ/RimL family protein N-acetyltransferase